jgi:hypothetical protein
METIFYISFLTGLGIASGVAVVVGVVWGLWSLISKK